VVVVVGRGGPVLVVVPLVFGEDLSGVCLVEDQNVVADLVAEGFDDWFAVCVRLRCLGCAGQDVHVVGSKDGVEGGRVLRVAVAEQKAERAQVRTDIGGEVAGLLCRPVLFGCSVTPAMWSRRVPSAVSIWKKVCGDDAAGLAGQEVFCTGDRLGVERDRRLPSSGSHTVDAAIRCPSPTSSPWILLWPQRGLS
jgi:hypothetical protein